jgi:DNA-binding GntR family transcriptional regulator
VTRLAEEGLVEVTPRRGSHVAPIRGAQVRESLVIRMALEVEAARGAALRADPLLAERLADNLARQDEAVAKNAPRRLHRLDEALHRAIFEAVNPAWSQRMLDLFRAPLDRPRRLTLAINPRPAETVAEHRRIVEAIAAGDADAAGEAMRDHLGGFESAVQREVARLAVG